MESATNKDRYILILYATQTGTAKDVAEDIARQLGRYHFRTQVASIDTYDIRNLPSEKLVIFVCSTTGQGEVPDAMKNCWKMLLSKKLPPTLLKNVQYAVFGLGDSSYVRFNFAAKMLFNRLKQLGATPLLRRGDGDDQHKFGLYGDLYNWMDELINVLQALYPLPPHLHVIDGSICVSFADNTNAATAKFERPQYISPEGQYSAKSPFLARLVSNNRITTADWDQDVRHIHLDISHSNIKYKPGDVCYILPQNSDEETNNFLSTALPGVDPNSVISAISPAQEGVGAYEVPCPISLFDLCKHFLDICGTPRRYFFEILSHFATDPREKERLQLFASKEGSVRYFATCDIASGFSLVMQEDMYDYSLRSKRTYIDVLRDFPSARPPIAYLLDMVPFLTPRAFSISSSQLLHPNAIHISMVVVRYKSYIHRLKRGVCSTWLANLDPAGKAPLVPIFVRPGTMTLPPDPKTPIIMVGPGTGCAIFRAFLQHRSALINQGTELGPAAFFFGCRHKSKDYLYEEEWKSHIDNNVLQLFDVAFSRDTVTEQGIIKKVYVQHIIPNYAKEIWSLLHNGAHFYLSGRANKMPTDVRNAIMQIIQTEGGMTADQAENYIRTMERTGRYVTETWS